MIEQTPIPGLVVLHPDRHEDERGVFSEVWNRDRMVAAGLHHDWCQDNHSLSRRKGTLRGLHFQAPPYAQAKLVRCVRGRIWDVAVDMRRGSPTCGRSFGIELSAENWAQVLVPAGFLHGFLTLEAETEVLYKVDAPFVPAKDGAIVWDDPDLAIDWPAMPVTNISDKDRAAPRVAEWDCPFVYEVQS